MRARSSRRRRDLRPMAEPLEALRMLDASQAVVLPVGLTAAGLSGRDALLSALPVVESTITTHWDMKPQSITLHGPPQAGAITAVAGPPAMLSTSLFRAINAARASHPGIRPMTLAPRSTLEGYASTMDAGASSSSGAGMSSSSGSGVGSGYGSGSASGYGSGSASGSYYDGTPINLTQTVTDGTSTANETFTFTPNADGTFAIDLQSNDSYGDPSAAGTDVSNTDPANIPNGGTDTYHVTINVGTDSITATLDENSSDSYSINGSLSGSSDSGTWTISGSDSYVYHDSVTISGDGSTSESYSLDTNLADKWSFTDSGSNWGSNFTLSGNGNDSAKDHEGDSGSGVSRNENDSQSQTINLTETTADGASVNAGASETLGYTDVASPATGGGAATDTVTKTDVGSDSSDYSGSGSIDGGTDSVSDDHSDTYNNSDSTTTTTSGGSSSVTETIDDSGTSKAHSQLSISGVDDPSAGSGSGSGSSSGSGSGGPVPQGTTDSLTETNDSNSSYDDKTTKSPDPNGGTDEVDVDDSTSTTSGSESGSTPWGPFSSSGGGTTTVDLTFDTTPQGTTETGSTTSTPPNGTSSGEFPTGPIMDDASTLAENAYMTPQGDLEGIDGQAGNDQMLLAQGPARPVTVPPLGDAQNPLPANAFRTLKDFTYDQAMQVGKQKGVDALKTIRDAYQNQLDNAEKVANLTTTLAKNFSDMKDLKTEINLGAFKFNSILIQAIRERAANLVNVGNSAIVSSLNAVALAYTNEVTRLANSIANINAAIVDITAGN